MLFEIVQRDRKLELHRRSRGNRRTHGVGLHHDVMLRAHQIDARIQQFLLRVEHVERRAGTEPRLLPDAVEGQLGCANLRLIGADLGQGAIQRLPRLCRGLYRAAHLLIVFLATL